MAERTRRLKVVWTQQAESQLQETLEYWINKNKSTKYANSLLLEVLSKSKKLETDPFLAPRTEFVEIRNLVVKDYSLFYKVLEIEIVILAFWDNRRNPDNLKNLLT